LLSFGGASIERWEADVRMSRREDAMDDIKRFLRSLPLFSTLSDDSMEQLLAKMKVKTFPPGALMVRFGRPGTFLGVILEGEAEAIRTDKLGRRRMLGKIGKGEYFGEMSLMTGEPTCADVVAREECRVALIPADVFSKVIATNPNAVRHLARTISRRLVVREEDPEERELVRDAWRNAEDPYRLRSGAGAYPMKVLVLECLGGSLRYGYFDEYEAKDLRGEVEGIGTEMAWHRYSSSRGRAEEMVRARDYAEAFGAICDVLTRPGTGPLESVTELTAIGHIVKWGGEIESSLPIDDALVKRLKDKLNLAPPQNRDNLAGIEQIRVILPDIPQVAVFETSYHCTVPPYAYLYGIPYEFYLRDGLRRYGSHGLAHNYAALKGAGYLKRPFWELKLITCYLDEAEPSVCAVDHGRSIDVGVGLAMGAERGDLDPAVVLYLLREKGLSPEELERMLCERGGLKGISGREEMEEIQEAAGRGDPRAILAVQMFCYRIKKLIGAYVASLGGLDGLIFTGGLGEGDPGVRARICQGLSYMGIILDEMRNRNPTPDMDDVAEVSDESSPVKVLVVPADEFRMAAVETLRALERRDVTGIIRSQPKIPIPIGVSARHVHLSQHDVEALFGEGYRLTPRVYLSQPGQYACEETVNLIGPKGKIERVRILGPPRRETQVEIARTDQYRLGIDAPIRSSGDLDGSPGITIEGPKGSITIPKGVICSVRHIHMSPEDALRFGLRDKDVVMVRVEGERPLIFGDVLVRVKPDFRLDMHIDTDEANAAGIVTGMVGYLEAIQSRK